MSGADQGARPYDGIDRGVDDASLLVDDPWLTAQKPIDRESVIEWFTKIFDDRGRRK